MSRSPVALFSSTLIALICLSLVSLAGCEIKEGELLSWRKDDLGHLKVASYVIDTKRPIESRKKGIRILAEGRHYDDIFSIYKHLEADETIAEPEKAFVSGELLALVEESINTSTSPETQTVAAELAFYLMSLDSARQLIAQRSDIIQGLARWSIGYLRSGREVIVPTPTRGASQVKEAQTTPADLLLSLLHITQAQDNGKAVFDLVKTDLAENIKKVDYVLRVHRVIHDLRNPKLSQEMAIALLAAARSSYPDGVTVDLVEAMIENQNETLLRFLIEICRDRRVSYDSLVLALNKAASLSEKKGLQKETLPLMHRVLSSSNTFAKITFRALRWARVMGEERDLKASLKSISPQFSAPVSGTDMKQEVDDFCQFIKDQKEEFREPLLELITEIKDQPELWPTRLYTLSCIHALYPDDFPKVMKRNNLFNKHFEKDDKKISAWRSDRPVTIGEIASEYMNPLR